MTTRALVLAGGGVTGIGWELGVMFGLRDTGIDILAWDRIVGTSAGSVVGAALGEPDGIDELVRAFTTLDGDRLRVLVGRRDPSVAGRIDELWFGPKASPDGPDRTTRVAIGRLAGLEDRELAAAYLEAIERILPSTAWPASLVITVVDADDGSIRTLDKTSGVSLARAVGASCAVPGVFPLVEIGGRRFMDGGVRSSSNAELAAGHDLVVVVAPNRPDGPWVERLARETAGLREAGAQVVEILLDDASLATFGTDTMDQSRAGPALMAGRVVGSRAGAAFAQELAARTTSG